MSDTTEELTRQVVAALAACAYEKQRADLFEVKLAAALAVCELLHAAHVNVDGVALTARDEGVLTAVDRICTAVEGARL